MKGILKFLGLTLLVVILSFFTLASTVACQNALFVFSTGVISILWLLPARRVAINRFPALSKHENAIGAALIVLFAVSFAIGDYKQEKENQKIKVAAEAKKQEEANALQAEKDELLAKKPYSLQAIAQNIQSGNYLEAQQEADKFRILNDPEIMELSNKANLAMLKSEKASAFRKMQDLVKSGDFQGAISISQRFKPLNDEEFTKLAAIAAENKKRKDAEEDTKRQQQEREDQAKRQAEDYFKTHRSSINMECRSNIEKSSNYDIRWEDESSIGERYGVRGDTGNITIAGSKAKIQTPLGAFRRITYLCVFDPRTQTVIRSNYEFAP